MQGKSSGRHWTELKKQGGPFLGRRGWLKQEAISLAPPQGNWKRALTRSNAWLITIVASGVSTMNVKYARVRQSETRILSWLHADDAVELLLANPQNKWTQAVLGWSNDGRLKPAPERSYRSWAVENEEAVLGYNSQKIAPPIPNIREVYEHNFKNGWNFKVCTSFDLALFWCNLHKLRSNQFKAISRRLKLVNFCSMRKNNLNSPEYRLSRSEQWSDKEKKFERFKYWQL